VIKPSARTRLMAPLAAAACALLTPIALRPGLPAVLLILAASGGCASYQVAANAAFVTAAPDSQRSQATGLAIAGLALGQGTAMIAAGTAAQRFTPTAVIAVAGALGAAATLALSLWHRHPDLTAVQP
jgi:hypothetical protein